MKLVLNVTLAEKGEDPRELEFTCVYENTSINTNVEVYFLEHKAEVTNIKESFNLLEKTTVVWLRVDLNTNSFDTVKDALIDNGVIRETYSRRAPSGLTAYSGNANVKNVNNGLHSIGVK